MENRNFILGHGERLTSVIAPPATKPDKNFPYEFGEAKKRLAPKIQDTATKVSKLPSKACPGDQAVVAFTLHPAFLAKSYYPKVLFDSLGLTPIGSRTTEITPEKWTKTKTGQEARTTTIFTSASRSTINAIPQKIATLSGDSNIASDIIKIENIESVVDVPRIGFIDTEQESSKLEIVLHAEEGDDSDIIEGFRAYIEELGGTAEIERRLYADGLCFMPASAPTGVIEEIEKFNFLRAVRSMPRLRSITRSSFTSGFEVEMPDDQPVDPGIRVAVFDGGMPDKSQLDSWVRKYELPGIGSATNGLLSHGLKVTSAVLFGPLSEDIKPERPYAFIDHYRVLDEHADNHADSEPDMYHVLTAIRNVIDSGSYSFVNLSIGPDMAIEDDPISSWTSILDSLFAKRKIFATIAAGNNGERDKLGGLARIQPPSDGVNSIAVGSANSQDGNWERAPYSAFGPGRSPGVIKPDVMAFGGEVGRHPFYVIDPGREGWAVADEGTSFAAPTALRTALGIRAHFGEVLTPIALKALLIDSAIPNRQSKDECGWGRVPTDFRDIVETSSDTVRVVYQGVLTPSSWLKAPIPLPEGLALSGNVQIKATICYFTETDAKDSGSYTKAGIEVMFRPNSEKYKDKDSQYPQTASFFKIKEFDILSNPLMHKGHFWETVLCASASKAGRTLLKPEFNLHYNARNGGDKAGSKAPEINYAMVVTVQAPKHPELYNSVVANYRTRLEPLTPVVEIPLHV